MPEPALSLFRITGLPLIEPGTDLAAEIVVAVRRMNLEVQDGDVFAVAQKIVSKAENRIVDLQDITPSPGACELAKKADKDPRLAELILKESM